MAELKYPKLQGAISVQDRSSKLGVWLIDHQNSEQDVQTVYNEAAKQYDNLSHKMGYVSPFTGTNILLKHLKSLEFSMDSKILDLGAGTGMCGEILYENGFTNLSAMDISEDMLEEAKKKKVYQQFIQKDLNSDSLADFQGAFDAAICVGVFFCGQANANALEKSFNMIRHGGIICFTIRTDIYDDEDSGYKKICDSLTKEGKWKMLFFDSLIIYEKLEANGYYLVLQKC